MDRVRLGYDLLRAYVYSLFLAAFATVYWFLAPAVADTPQVASLWLAVAGFGVLVGLTFALTQYGRRA